jgi:hypothetical protein
MVVIVYEMRPALSFVTQLPLSLTHLRLTCRAHHFLDGLESLKQMRNLKELDVHVLVDHPGCIEEDWYWWPNGSHSLALGKALAGMNLKKVGLHVLQEPMYLPDLNVPQMQRTFRVGAETWSRFGDQINYCSRQSITMLALHVGRITYSPSLLGCSALTELVIGDIWRNFGQAYSMPFSLKGLETVAATLRHLTVSSSRGCTRVKLPGNLQLRSFVCVCSGVLLLDCKASILIQNLGDVLLGYTTIRGTGVRLVEELSPRLGTAVLEVLGAQKLRQILLFTRAGLVGEWWHGVFQVSKQQQSAGCFCCRVRVWSKGCLCPSYLTFSRYGIFSAHDDREVLRNDWDIPLSIEFTWPSYPAWHDEVGRDDLPQPFD